MLHKLLSLPLFPRSNSKKACASSKRDEVLIVVATTDFNFDHLLRKPTTPTTKTSIERQVHYHRTITPLTRQVDPENGFLPLHVITYPQKPFCPRSS